MSYVFEEHAESGQDWTAKATWMRDMGATRAQWDAANRLVHLELGPKPPSANDTATQDAEIHQLEPREAEADRVRRIAMGAASGLVKRSG